MGVQCCKLDRVKVAAEMARARCGVQELATRATLGRATIRKAKNELAIATKAAAKIAAALGVPLADLLMN